MAGTLRGGERVVAFVHRFAELPPVSDVIALTPNAWEGAVAAGHRPTVLDDHIDRRSCNADIDEYTRWQIDWFRRLDAAAGSDGALRAAALFLQTPMDSLVLAARYLTSAVTTLMPDHVAYVGSADDRQPDPLHGGHIQFWPRYGDAPLASLVLPVVTAGNGLPLTRIGTDYETWPAPTRAANPVRRRVGPVIRQAQLLRPGRHNAGGKTLLLWSSGYGAVPFAAEQRLMDHQLLAIERGRPRTRILAGSTLGRSAAGPAVDTGILGPDAAVPKLSTLPALLDEIDDWAGAAGIGRLLASRADVFVRRIGPTIARAAEAFQSQLERLDIDQVVAANPSSVEEYAVLLAAGRLGIRRVLLQHGDHLVTYRSWLVTEMQNADEFWASDASVVADIQEYASAYRISLPEFRLRSPRTEAARRIGSAAARRGKRTVCYIPTHLSGDSDTFGSGKMEDAWYHRWHRRLLDVMASRPETTFIWKALPGSDQSIDPMPDLIAGATNVRYETGQLTDALALSDRVIVDFPSTPLYEAVHARRPVLALVFPFTELRAPAAELFAPAIRKVSSEDAAAQAVLEFLDDEDARRRLVSSEAVLP